MSERCGRAGARLRGERERLSGVEHGRGIDRHEASHPAVEVVSEAVDGGVEQALVSGELLQRANARPGAHDGDDIARLNVMIDELLQCRADLRDAYRRESEIIDHQRDHALHLAGFDGKRRWDSDYSAFGGCRRERSRRLDALADIVEVGDLLRGSVLEDFKVVGFEIGHRMASRIGDHGIDPHEIHVDTNHKRVGVLRRGIRSGCSNLGGREHTREEYGCDAVQG
jgi:hypothetical protein